MGRTKKNKATSTKVSKRKANESTPKEFIGNEGLLGKPKKNFEELERIAKFKPTKFLQTDHLQSLGVADMVKELLSKVGLGDCFDYDASTYKNLTLEFLATLEEITCKNGNPGIKFRTYKQYYEIDLDGVRDALDIAKLPVAHPVKPEAMEAFWKDITKKTYHKNSTNSQIPHPALRIASRYINTNYLALSEPTKMTRTTLNYLWAMTPSGEGIPDWATLFIKGCLKIQAGKKKVMPIHIGGMILKVFVMAGATLPPNAKEVPGGNELVVPELQVIGMLKVVNRKSFASIWCLGERVDYMHLPRPSTSPLTWGSAKDFYMPPDEEFAYLHDPSREKPTNVDENEENVRQEEALEEMVGQEIQMEEVEDVTYDLAMGYEGNDENGALEGNLVAEFGTLEQNEVPDFGTNEEVLVGRTPPLMEDDIFGVQFLQEDIPNGDYPFIEPSYDLPPRRPKYQPRPNPIPQPPPPHVDIFSPWQVNVNEKFNTLNTQFEEYREVQDRRWEEQEFYLRTNRAMMVSMHNLTNGEPTLSSQNYTQAMINKEEEELRVLRERRESAENRFRGLPSTSRGEASCPDRRVDNSPPL